MLGPDARNWLQAVMKSFQLNQHCNITNRDTSAMLWNKAGKLGLLVGHVREWQLVHEVVEFLEECLKSSGLHRKELAPGESLLR